MRNIKRYRKIALGILASACFVSGNLLAQQGGGDIDCSRNYMEYEGVVISCTNFCVIRSDEYGTYIEDCCGGTVQAEPHLQIEAVAIYC